MAGPVEGAGAGEAMTAGRPHGRLVSRREFVANGSMAGLAAAMLGAMPLAGAGAGAAHAAEGYGAGGAGGGASGALWVGFPKQDADLVRQVVTVAHTNVDEVRALVTAKPALANAWWDWGFGDWESPLGAAAHVGRREIAEFLIAHGARVDIFAAAMLGQTAVVAALVAAQPGVQRTLGPHGIPLLAHARAGGEAAMETLAYLEGLGDAGNGPRVEPLADERKPAFVGTYAIDGAADERLDVTLDAKNQLSIGKGSFVSRRMHHAGGEEFFPAGVPSVRIRFDVREGAARSLTMTENGAVIAATRVAG